MNSESVKSVLLKGVLSGVLLGIGCIIFLVIDNKYIGSVLFSFGLFIVIQKGFALFTGKVEHSSASDPSHIKKVLITLAGSIAGIFVSIFFISILF